MCISGTQAHYGLDDYATFLHSPTFAFKRWVHQLEPAGQSGTAIGLKRNALQRSSGSGQPSPMPPSRTVHIHSSTHQVQCAHGGTKLLCLGAPQSPANRDCTGPNRNSGHRCCSFRRLVSSGADEITFRISEGTFARARAVNMTSTTIHKF